MRRPAAAVLALTVLALPGCSLAEAGASAVETAMASVSPTPTTTQTSVATTETEVPTETPTESEVPTETSAAPAPATPPGTPAAAQSGTALALLNTLPVKGKAPKTGYKRSEFGQAWLDADRNGCDTRNDILMRDLTDEDMSGRCKVLSGTLPKDAYTGKTINFVRGGEYENALDVDHVVPLGNGWITGMQGKDKQVRAAYANDPLNLIAVDPSANRQKGDGDAATWLPKNKAYRCTYVATQIAVKAKYGLWVAPAEKDAMVRVLNTCPTQKAPTGGIAPRVTFPVK